MSVLLVATGVTALAVALESFFSPIGAPVVAAGLGGTLLLVFLVDTQLSRAVLVVVFVCLVGAQITTKTVLEEPARVFVADIAWLPLVVVGATRFLVRRRWPMLGHHFLVLVGIGIVLTITGVWGGNAFPDAAGTFRRLCLYPAAYIVALAAAPLPSSAARDFRRMAILAGLAVSGIAVYRIATGEGYAHEYFEQSNSVIRFISYIEAFAPILALLVLLSESASTQPRNRPRNLVLIWILLLGLVVSNYRAVWGALGVALGVWALISGRRTRRALLPTAALIGIAGIAAVSVLWITNPDGLPLHKLSLVNLHKTSSWRIGSWSRAIDVFLESPLIGAGFGYHHRFHYLTGENFDVWGVSEGHTVHNDLLWLAANGGLVLTVVVVGFHYRWWRRCRGALGSRPLALPEGRALAAVLGTYSGILAVAMFQPVLSVPAAVMATYLLMGFGGGLALRLEKTRRESE